MGLLGWIKKEIESNSRQRRQSAPPPLIDAHRLTHADHARDEAYKRAIAKFNQWRDSQRFERLNETKNASEITQSELHKTADEINITDVELEEDEKKRLIQMGRRDEKKNKSAIYSNEAEMVKTKRLSLPLMLDKDASFRGNRKKFKFKQPTSTIDEIEEFEQNHCRDFEEYSFANTVSPPSKFYCSNSKPYESAEKVKKEGSGSSKMTPKRLMGRNMLRRQKGKAPQPPKMKDETSEASANNFNGNFKHFEVSSASMYDEFVISSKAYKGQLRKEQPEKINSVGESASSGSLSSDPEKNIKKQRRLSPPYQTVVNKHGDVVEYALPYNERDDIPPLPTAPVPANNARSSFEQVIDQNFKFLNSKLDFLHSQIDHNEDDDDVEHLMNGKICNVALEPIDASFSDVRRQNLQITDLDRSNETGLAFNAQSGDIIKDLEALSKWTQNLEKMEKNYSSPVNQYQSIQNNIKIFNSHDIKYKSGELRNSFSTPLEFSNAYFHCTPITLRSTWPNNYNLNTFADLACKREFEILSQIKHANMASLMGISIDEDLRTTSLVMEPFDYTLNHYLHKMDKFYTLQQTLSIVHQIACATQYLHECGLIHSNISSHAVLIRDNPFAVKLSSFELVTDILPREAIGRIYHPQTSDRCDKIFTQESTDIAVVEKYTKLSKQHFYNRTSLPAVNVVDDDASDENEYLLPYSIAYRRMFSMHYYQAPELLIPTNDATNVKYVLPTLRSDVYALALLLWESINRVVPYVVYNHDELISGLKQGKAQLPMLDSSCILFKEIFDHCLHADGSKRISDVSKFIIMLEDIRSPAYDKEKIEVLEIIEPDTNRHKREAVKNFKNIGQHDKLREKIYFTKSDVDPQKRFENAFTNENLIGMGLRDVDPKVSESIQSAEIEPHIVSFSQQPGIMLDDALDRIRKTVEDQRESLPKKPARKKDDDVFEMSKNSTMFQSFFDINRLQSPKVDKDVIYERTSTLKKRLKEPDEKQQRKSVKELFDPQPAPDKQMLDEQFAKMNTELNQIIQDYDKSDFMQEIVQEFQTREKSGKDEGTASFLNKGMAKDISLSVENLQQCDKQEVNVIKRYGSDVIESKAYGENSLPHTPIARQNKLRRNAWLSDGAQRPTSLRISEEISKRCLLFTKNAQKQDTTKNNSNRKQYNVNIRIHHNDLEQKDKSTNLSQNNNNHNNSSLINIKLYNSPGGGKNMPVVKVKNVDLNKSSYTEDINKKYYPMMPELLSDVIQNRRDRSSFLQTSTADEGQFEKVGKTWKRKGSNVSSDADNECDEHDSSNGERIIVPVRKSVRETIELIEQTFNPKAEQNVEKSEAKCAEEKVLKNNETQTDEGAECLMQASESIQKLENIIPTTTITNKFLENVQVSSSQQQTPTKITTKVTVNVQKYSTRSSDVSHLKQVQEQARHSICNNSEILKRLRVHFQGKDPAIMNGKNDEISASCSSLVSKDCNGEVAPANGRQKYFCRNCGFTMIPTEILQRLQNTGRLSIASSIAENLHAIKYDDNMQSLSTIRRCQQIETKSTEDLYIDDDFCQGVTQSLAANMELMPPPDFFDSIDFNILSAEFFHTQEHEYDDTLKEIEGSNVEALTNGYHVDNDGNENDEDENGELRVPICDEKEIKKQEVDEPKVEQNEVS